MASLYKLYASLFAFGAARGCVALPFYLRSYLHIYIYMYIYIPL